MPKSDAQQPLVESVMPFQQVLARLEGGDFHNAVSDALHDLNCKLADHAKNGGKAKGELAIKLKMALDGPSMLITAEVVVKEPKGLRSVTPFYLTPGNNLSTKDPRQVEMPLRAAPSAEAPRAVTANAGPTKAV